MLSWKKVESTQIAAGGEIEWAMSTQGISVEVSDFKDGAYVPVDLERRMSHRLVSQACSSRLNYPDRYLQVLYSSDKYHIKQGF